MSAGFFDEALRNALAAAAVPEGTFKAQKPSKLLVLRQVVDALGIKMRFNEFTRKVEIEWPGKPARELADHDEAIIRNEMFIRDASVFPGVVTDYLYTEALKHVYHPVRDYLDGLRWDGEERLDHWLTRYVDVADSPYVRKVGANVLVAAVKRVLEPGCKFDECLVLVGDEGSGKSTAIKSLVPVESWFTDSLPINSSPKQVIEGTAGIWIVETAELVGAANIERVKAFLSRASDGPVRGAYARHAEAKPRQFIVIGTTNSRRPVPSETGARRFWPVNVGCVKFEAIAANRDQLWAEAHVRALRGDTTYITSELFDAAMAAQQEFTATHHWKTVIEEKLATLPYPPNLIPVSTVWGWLDMEKGRKSHVDVKELTDVMRLLRYHREEKLKMVDGRMVNVFSFMNPLDPSSAITARSAQEEDEYVEDVLEAIDDEPDEDYE